MEFFSRFFNFFLLFLASHLHSWCRIKATLSSMKSMGKWMHGEFLSAFWLPFVLSIWVSLTNASPVLLMCHGPTERTCINWWCYVRVPCSGLFLHSFLQGRCGAETASFRLLFCTGSKLMLPFLCPVCLKSSPQSQRVVYFRRVCGHCVLVRQHDSVGRGKKPEPLSWDLGNIHTSYVFRERGHDKPRYAAQLSLRGDTSASGEACSGPRFSVKTSLYLHCITALSCRSLFKAHLPQGDLSKKRAAMKL